MSGNDLTQVLESIPCCADRTTPSRELGPEADAECIPSCLRRHASGLKSVLQCKQLLLEVEGHAAYNYSKRDFLPTLQRLVALKELDVVCEKYLTNTGCTQGVDLSTGEIVVVSTDTVVLDHAQRLATVGVLISDSPLDGIRVIRAALEPEEVEEDVTPFHVAKSARNIVYKGRMGSLDVAVKLHMQGSRARAKAARNEKALQTEINNARMLDHPHVMGLVCEPPDGLPCLVTEWLPTFEHYCNYNGITDDRLLVFVEQLLSAVAYIHSQGLVHGSITSRCLFVAGPSAVRLSPPHDGASPPTSQTDVSACLNILNTYSCNQSRSLEQLKMKVNEPAESVLKELRAMLPAESTKEVVDIGLECEEDEEENSGGEAEGGEVAEPEEESEEGEDDGGCSEGEAGSSQESPTTADEEEVDKTGCGQDESEETEEAVTMEIAEESEEGSEAGGDEASDEWEMVDNAKTVPCMDVGNGTVLTALRCKLTELGAGVTEEVQNGFHKVLRVAEELAK